MQEGGCARTASLVPYEEDTSDMAMEHDVFSHTYN